MPTRHLSFKVTEQAKKEIENQRNKIKNKLRIDRMTPQEILNLPLESNDAEAKTIKEYLVALLLKLWEEKEGFSGKCPFGNSSWEYEVYQGLVAANAVEGELDEDGRVETCNEKWANEIIITAIKSL